MTTYGTFPIDSVPSPSDRELAIATSPAILDAIEMDRQGSEMEREMREQVELMDMFAYQLGLCVAVDRAGDPGRLSTKKEAP